MDTSLPASPWDEHADGWDEDSAARAYASAVYRSLVDALASHGLSLDGAVICDFGCGTGLLTERMFGPACLIDAVDTSAAMLAVLADKIERLGASNVHPSTSLPNSARNHDLVVCSSVLGFVPEYPQTVRQLTQLLRPGGLFVQWDWEFDDAQPEPHGLSQVEIAAALDAAGLVDIEVETAFEITVEDTTMRPIMGIGHRLKS